MVFAMPFSDKGKEELQIRRKRRRRVREWGGRRDRWERSGGKEGEGRGGKKEEEERQREREEYEVVG